jgi:ubiquitin carboxyl-terminal hydrolase 25/28
MHVPGEESCHHHPHGRGLHSIVLSDGPDTFEPCTSTDTKYYPFVTGCQFHCASQPCNLVVSVEFSEPRLPWNWIELLQDTQRIKDRITAAKIADPKRYEDASDEWVDGLSHLWTYLRHILENTDEPRLLKKKNKRFDVVMGPELYELFRWLEFEEITVGNSGAEEEVFKQNLPEPPSAITKCGSRRAFYEDVRAEVRNLIWRKQLESSIQEINENLLEHQLQLALGYADYERVKYDRSEVYRHYRFLGAMPDFSGALLEACLDQRIMFDPDNRACYEDSLYSIARDATGPLGRDPTFFRRATTIVGSDPEDQFNQCWGLNIGNTRRTDDEVIEAFEQTIRDSPDKIDTALDFFCIYCRSRKSNRLTKIISRDMPLYIAYALVGATHNDTSEQILQRVAQRVSIPGPALI